MFSDPLKFFQIFWKVFKKYWRVCGNSWKLLYSLERVWTINSPDTLIKVLEPGEIANKEVLEDFSHGHLPEAGREIHIDTRMMRDDEG